MKICPVCQRCYEDADIACEQEGHDTLAAARPGTRLIAEKYRLDRLLARGGMGAVYAGTHVELDRLVAIKLLLPNFNADQQAFERFRREARAAARIKHPNVADIYDYGTLTDDEAYIVMELVEGQTLHEKLKVAGQVPFAETIAISRQIAEGMEAAHGSGIVHRDLKPSNIIINQTLDGGLQVKIIDFGIAKISEQIAEGDSTLTATGMLVGTPRYMSPEQCQGNELDARSDIYSFGVIVYEMLAGQPPFDAASAVAIAFKHIHESPAPLEEHRQNVPPLLTRLVADALAVDPQARPQTATGLKSRLEQVESAFNEQAASDPPSPALQVEEVDELQTQVMNVEEKSANASADEYATAVMEAQPPDKDESKTPPLFDVKSEEIKQAVPLKPAPSTTNIGAGPISTTVLKNINKLRARRRQSSLIYAGIAVAFVIGVIALWAATRRTSSHALEEAAATSTVPMKPTPTKQPSPSPTPTASPSATPSEESSELDTEQARAEINRALGDWIAATNASDINTQMSFYNPTVEAFYRTRNVSHDAVRAEKQRLFDQAEKIEVQAGQPQIKFSNNGQTVTTRFRKRYVIEGTEENRQGEVVQELRWIKTEGGWKIVSERDLRVLRNPGKASKNNPSNLPHQVVLRGFKKLIQTIR